MKNMSPAPPPVQHRVLVVDDDSVTRLLIVHHLKKNGYEVVQASGVDDAKTAIQRRQAAALDAVVTDYLMPGGTGLELIEWLKKHDETVAAIVVTSVSERDLVKESLRGGACDFLDKPVQIPALLASVQNAIDTTLRARHLKNTESSVQEVGRFQQFLLGSRVGERPTPVEICWHPMHPVGGDLVNVIPLGPRRCLLLVADVSGHDLKAGFISAYFQGVVRGMVELGAPIKSVFEYFNRFLVSEWSQNQDPELKIASVAASISACAFVVDLELGKLTVFNSGFPVPICATPDGECEPASRTAGFPLGWFLEDSVDVTEHDLARHSDVYVWTDGLEDLAGSLGVNPMALAAELIAARREGRTSSCLQSANDDILLVRLKIRDSGADTDAPRHSPLVYQELAGDSGHQIDSFQAVWEQSLRLGAPDLPEDRLYDLLLCSREAVINAIRYGFNGASGHGALQIIRDRDAALLRVTVSDPGPGHDFRWEPHLQTAAAELMDRHRGLALLHQLPAVTRTERNGARVSMDFSTLKP